MGRAQQFAMAHGCTNDCLYLRPVPSEEFATEADVATLAQQVQILLDSNALKHPDDSPMFKIERTKHDEIALADAPEVTWRWNFPSPKLSRWKPDSWNDPVIEMVKDDEWQEAAEKGEMPGYGYWSLNGNFQLQRSWVIFEEEEGLGRGDDDTFQEEAA